MKNQKKKMNKPALRWFWWLVAYLTRNLGYFLAKIHWFACKKYCQGLGRLEPDPEIMYEFALFVKDRMALFKKFEAIGVHVLSLIHI